MAEIKFCGLTRAADALHAATLGAAYVGVIFADSPRKVTDQQAAQIFGGVPPSVRRVGVFGAEAPAVIGERAGRLGLDVIQLHGDPDARLVARLRERWTGVVWAVARVRGSDVPRTATELFEAADAVVLDALADGRLGGTGVALPWEALRDGLQASRGGRARLVLAGGLRADNVASAVELLAPDVVDVSSGVERDVGVKDHERMRAFRDAVQMARSR